MARRKKRDTEGRPGIEATMVIVKIAGKVHPVKLSESDTGYVLGLLQALGGGVIQVYETPISGIDIVTPTKG